MNLQKSQKLCKFYISGRCKYGQNCHYSHQAIESFLIRHATSEFNQRAQQSIHDMYSQEAKKQYQTDQDLIDCGITKSGYQEIKQMNFQILMQNKSLDAIFVSPLNRALITASQIIKTHEIKCKKVIVIPYLTQVMSKICDFSGPIQTKLKQYPNFDFGIFKEMPQQMLDKWQDEFIDQNYLNQIDNQKKSGKRYTKLLETIFPTPLQDSSHCFMRSCQAVNQMKTICLKQGYKKVGVVSHNRVLKYISGRYQQGRSESFENSQIRRVLI